MKFSFAVFLAACACAGSLSAKTLIHAGTLIDGASDQPRKDVTLVIDGERIVDVVAGFAAPAAGDKVIDLKKSTVLPGLMDMHTHLSGESNPQAYLERFTMSAPEVTLRTAAFARKTLQAGFTTVRDLGDPGGFTIALRKAIAQGIAEGPRIFTAGKSIATSGGHADPSNSLAGRFDFDPGPREGVVNGPDEARKAVRLRYKETADLIKITATGGVLSMATSAQNPQFTEEEIKAIVETARDYGYKVAVHAHGAEGMKRAIRAGVDSIEHGTYMDEEVIELMRKHGTWLVPTLLAGKFVAEKAADATYFPSIVRPKAAAVGPLMAAMFAKAHRAGVKIAFGTDTGVSPHGDNAQEFALMVAAGMPPMAAIQCATRNAAQLLGQEQNLGTLEKGKFADVIAVSGDPLADIKLLQRVAFVMKGGQIVKQ
ncbi:MAG: amidohydrolase family protein [Verrucomicrobia bacterium]|nr:amidohydrolase family protein [Verrucomicrobiota bacterium]